MDPMLIVLLMGADLPVFLLIYVVVVRRRWQPLTRRYGPVQSLTSRYGGVQASTQPLLQGLPATLTRLGSKPRWLAAPVGVRLETGGLFVQYSLFGVAAAPLVRLLVPWRDVTYTAIAANARVIAASDSAANDRADALVVNAGALTFGDNPAIELILPSTDLRDQLVSHLQRG